jgi:hypothetical protein
MIRRRSSSSPAYGADEAFGDRVRPRRAHRRLDDLDADGGERGVEGRGEAQAAPARPLPHRVPTELRKIKRHDRVGGLLHEYQHVA